MTGPPRNRVRLIGGIALAGAAAIALAVGIGQAGHWPAGGAAMAEPTPASEAKGRSMPNPAVPAPLSSLFDGREWLNTPPLRPEDLRGKVVLVNFWTYSCINSLRPLPYLRAWDAKYRAQGLVIIGVHAPEFGFEKKLTNVRQAVAEQGVRFPVALDSDFTSWRAFGNRGWPGFVFIGADGRVRHERLGEGDYAESEQLIRQLLAEAGHAPAAGAIADIPGQGIQAAPDWASLRSPETYIGYGQAERFDAPGGMRKDAPARYAAPADLPLNHWSLAGAWTVGGEYATLDAGGGSICYRFHARDLHLVLGARAGGRPVRFRVLIDGAAPGADHGTDVDAEGWGTLREDRLYQLVRQSRPVADRTFEIQFSAPGARAYVFTFG